jgi:hypothetical protein
VTTKVSIILMFWLSLPLASCASCVCWKLTLPTTVLPRYDTTVVLLFVFTRDTNKTPARASEHVETP